MTALSHRQNYAPRASRWIGLGLTLALIALSTLYAPAEKTLGAGARLVYLHGAIVWTAILAFTLAAGLGLAGLLAFRWPRQASLHGWSRAFARTGLLLWLTQTPMSLLVMRLNWGGLFLDEPRWRVSLTFAVVGLLVQVAVALMGSPRLASAASFVYGVALLAALNQIVSVMHPDSPILSGSAGSIQFFFALLVVLNCLLAGQIAFLWGAGRDAGQATGPASQA